MYSYFVAFFIHINIGVGDPMTKRGKLTPSYCCAWRKLWPGFLLSYVEVFVFNDLRVEIVNCSCC